MKILKVVTTSCDCRVKLDGLRQANMRAGLPAWAPGTRVECDCGTRYTLADDQREGLYWSRVVTRGGE